MQDARNYTHARSFNNGMTWLNGLWAGGKSGNSDFATIVYELQLLVRC